MEIFNPIINYQKDITMKKTINAALSGYNFIFEEDAYEALSSYLESYRTGLDGTADKEAKMNELETRISTILRSGLNSRDTVNVEMVNNAAQQCGMPNWTAGGASSGQKVYEAEYVGAEKKLYRDMDNKMLGGVCSGLSLYFNVDVVLLRILFLVALFIGSAGFWIYIAICIVAPAARTPKQKCEMRGIPATEENMRRFA